jgi:uncharacterized protein YndB with AHSA1/START domain
MTIPLATTVDIDNDAPVISREELFIPAPLETVWKLHIDVDAWPGWRSDVDSAQLAGPFGAGSAFRWRTAGLDITSTITQVVPGSRTTWGGPAGGIDGVHVWEFTPRDGGVLVRTKESWSGDPVGADAPALQSALDESLRVWLRDLRAEAERLRRTP